MTGSEALDIAIGLIFIFLLLSLFTSAISELVASSITLRGRNLLAAISFMWYDKKEIKELTQSTQRDLESKIQDEVKNKKVTIDVARTNHLEKLKANFKGTFTKEENESLEDQLKRIIKLKTEEECKASILSLRKALLDDPILRKRSEQKWFTIPISGLSIFSKKLAPFFASKPEYIEKQKFAQVVLDYINEKRENQEATDNWEEAIDRVVPVGTATNKLFKQLVDKAEGKASRFVYELESWYDEITVIAIEWYKKRIRYVLFVLGLFVSISMNADTLDIVAYLSNNPEERARLVEQAERFYGSAENTDPNSTAGDSIDVEPPTELNNNKPQAGSNDEGAPPDTNDVNTSADSIPSEPQQPLVSPPTSNPEASNEPITEKDTASSNLKIDSKVAQALLKQVDPLLQQQINEAKLVSGIGWHVEMGACVDQYQALKDEYEERVIIFPLINYYISTFDKYTNPDKVEDMSTRQKVWCATKASPNHLLGWILTAFAISFGAPFWYDALAKVINLKNAATVAKKQAASTSSLPTDTPVG